VLAAWATGLDRFHARMLDHRMWMIGIALGAGADRVLFAAMPSEMFPTRTAISPRSASKWCPAPPSPRPRSWREGGRARRRGPRWIGAGGIRRPRRVFITLKKDRTTKTGDFERELTPRCSRLPMRVSLSVRPQSGFCFGRVRSR
jgi:hypothetical protein